MVTKSHILYSVQEGKERGGGEIGYETIISEKICYWYLAINNLITI